MLSLGAPWALLGLVLLAAAWWRHLRRPHPALAIPDGDAALAAATGPWLRRLSGACRLFGLALAVLALADPRLGDPPVTWRGQGVDIVFAVDLSESMAAMDFRQDDRSVTRLAAVTAVAARFAASRPGDRLGLVACGTRAHTVLPPTADQAALLRALETLEVGAAGKRTALGDAVVLAVKRLADAPGQSRVVVVLSDGRQNAGAVSLDEAAALAASLGITVHAVGVGGDAPAPFLVDHPLLGPEIVYEKADIDEAALAALARTTGGLYWRATDNAGLEAAARRVAAMAPSDMAAVVTGERPGLAPLLAAAAVVLLATFAVLSAGRFARWP